MAATVTAASTVRYAPEDHTLPKPWKGLVDDNTGYLYYWNLDTNVTQYEKPTGPQPSKFSAVFVSSAIQIQQTSSGQNGVYGPRMMTSTAEALTVGLRLNLDQGLLRMAEVGQHILMALLVELGILGMVDHLLEFLLHQLQENELSPEAYCRRHEITVNGGQVPPPLTTFEATGFPPELLREVRCLLLGGANVVRCATSLKSLQIIWSAL